MNLQIVDSLQSITLAYFLLFHSPLAINTNVPIDANLVALVTVIISGIISPLIRVFGESHLRKRQQKRLDKLNNNELPTDPDSIK